MILEDLVEDFPQIPDYRHDLCETYARLDVGGPQTTIEALPVMEELLCKGFAISEELVSLHPNVPSYAACQVRILLKLGDVLQRQGRIDDAETRLAKALAVQSSLVNRFPKASSYKVWLVQIKRSLARILGEGDRIEEARALLEESLEVLDALWKTEPRREHLRGLLGASCRDLADILYRIGDDEAAEKALGRGRKYRDNR